MSEPPIPPAVAVSGVSKRYGHVTALAPVSLAIDPGEVVAFLGHNGAGKTTLLRIIATHAAPSSGTVRVFGQDASRHGPGVRRRIGLVTHESYLYPELTVRENLRFFARLFSVDGEAGYGDLVDRFELRRWYGAAVGTLSFGLRKRAEIVRALLHAPDLILLDEPFAGLDTRTCGMLVDLLAAERKAGRTILLSSHSPEWLDGLCGREVVFERGKIVRDGRHAEGEERA